jgi:hypothetical protein
MAVVWFLPRAQSLQGERSMKVKWFTRGTLALAIVGLIFPPAALPQQTALDQLKAQAPAMLKAGPKSLNNAQVTQTMSMKRFAKASSGAGMQTQSLPGEAKKPENAYYYLGLAAILLNDPQVRSQASDSVHGALQFLQAPQQLHDILTAAQSDPAKVQDFANQSWQWVQTRGQSGAMNFCAGAWTATNLVAIGQQKTFKLEFAKGLSDFYAQTGPQQAVPILNGIMDFSTRQLATGDLQQLSNAFGQLANLLS